MIYAAARNLLQARVSTIPDRKTLLLNSNYRRGQDPVMWFAQAVVDIQSPHLPHDPPIHSGAAACTVDYDLILSCAVRKSVSWGPDRKSQPRAARTHPSRVSCLLQLQQPAAGVRRLFPLPSA